LKRTSSGIHRDDLIFLMDDHVVKKFSSQGQQKSFLIALKLSQYKLLFQYKGVFPFLLLDDIFDKLDEERSKNLLAYISNKDWGQVFISDTQRERIERIFGKKIKKVAIFQIDQLN